MQSSFDSDHHAERSGSGGGTRAKIAGLISQAKQQGTEWFYYGLDIWNNLSVIKKILVVLVGAFVGFMGVTMIIFHDKVLQTLVTFSKKWKEMKGGGLLMFFLVVLVSFPPLIGYSALASLTGMMYGFVKGWVFLTVATIVGSTLSFLVFRYLLSGYAKRLATRNTKFAALSSTLEHDKFTLLWMIRLCPLPYSLSNGALSSIPSVSVGRFTLATLLTSPKLFMHIFIGERTVRLGTEKDTAAKIVDFVSIGLAGLIGTVTAYLIYMRTMERVKQIEAIQYDTLDDFELSSDEES